MKYELYKLNCRFVKSKLDDDGNFRGYVNYRPLASFTRTFQLCALDKITKCVQDRFEVKSLPSLVIYITIVLSIHSEDS